MKKMLTVFLILLIATCALADVTIRVVFVSFVSGSPGGEETLTVGIEAYATYAYRIDKFQGSFDMGANLADQLNTHQFLNNTYFGTTWYTQDCDVTGSTIYFYYKFTGDPDTEKLNRKKMTKDTWERICNIELKYDYDASKKTTFTWTENQYYYVAEVIAYIDIGEGDPAYVPITVQGGKVNMPSELKDRSLPVQMSSLVGKFDYEKGNMITWKTQSETDCAGFHIMRSASENGEYVPITTAMIQAQGNSSEEHQYTYIDKNVNLDSKYWYKIQEISTIQGFSNDIYYGQLAVATPKPPAQFALEQNFPNPFNPDTKIAYELPERANVTLQVYNLLGKEVRTIVNEEKQPGKYEASWDGMDQAGKILPSGLYFYKMTAGDKIEIRKMMKVH